MPTVSVINSSSVVPNSDLVACCGALQAQVTNHFKPVWGIDAVVKFVPNGSRPDPGSWWLVILDDSDSAEYLGFHEVTSESLPQGKVFANSDLQNGTNWTVTASHELLEMLADPDLKHCVSVDDPQQGHIVISKEICDPCEGDQFGYQLDNILVSDFVTPAWFETFQHPAGTKFDCQGFITQPLQILPGGYIGTNQSADPASWGQLSSYDLSGGKMPWRPEFRVKTGSRRERRGFPRGQWRNSNPAWDKLKAKVSLMKKTGLTVQDPPKPDKT